MYWLSNSARTICSVKFFEPIIIRRPPAGWQLEKTNESRTINMTVRRCMSSHRQPLFRPAQAHVRHHCQNGGWNRSCENHLVIHHCHAAENIGPQTACPDGCGNGRDADGYHRGYTNEIGRASCRERV